MNTNKEAIKHKNQSKFDELRKFNFNPADFLITGSGALGIRNLREIDDIDLVASLELWESLKSKYNIINENGIQKIVLVENLIEVFYEGSYAFDGSPSVAERFKKAEIIDGLPFESLEHVIYFKSRMGREKDLNDIELLARASLLPLSQ